MIFEQIGSKLEFNQRKIFKKLSNINKLDNILLNGQ